MMVMEFWAGWFDYWGCSRNPLDNVLFRRHLEMIINRGASVNFYMFHGGTNFGFTSGAITLERGYYTADVTSYDYDCPITEDGRPNTKEVFQNDLDSITVLTKTLDQSEGYFLYTISNLFENHFKFEIIQTLLGSSGAKRPELIKTGSYPSLKAQKAISLWSEEFQKTFETFSMDQPVPMEMLETKNGCGQPYGYVLYSIEVESISDDITDLKLSNLQR